jgi:hypothetical protein
VTLSGKLNLVVRKVKSQDGVWQEGSTSRMKEWTTTPANAEGYPWASVLRVGVADFLCVQAERRWLAVFLWSCELRGRHVGWFLKGSCFSRAHGLSGQGQEFLLPCNGYSISLFNKQDGGLPKGRLTSNLPYRISNAQNWSIRALGWFTHSRGLNLRNM